VLLVIGLASDCRTRPPWYDRRDRDFCLSRRLAGARVWATCFLIVIARGPGIFSLDHLLQGVGGAAEKLSKA